MSDKRADSDRIIIASLHGEARRWARKRDLTEAEREAAVDELRKLAGGRADLLAHVAGITEGFAEAEPDEATERRAAALCRAAGADPEEIPEWAEIGRQRRADSRRMPFSGGVRRPEGNGPANSVASAQRGNRGTRPARPDPGWPA